MVWGMVVEAEAEQRLLSQPHRHPGAAGAQSAASDHPPQRPTMDRRRFVTTLAAAVPAGALAQAPGKVARVGWLSSARRPTDAELQQSPWALEMQRLGWVEGRNLIVDRRYSDGDTELLARHAR
jgi:hypothetical protein